MNAPWKVNQLAPTTMCQWHDVMAATYSLLDGALLSEVYFETMHSCPDKPSREEKRERFGPLELDLGVRCIL